MVLLVLLVQLDKKDQWDPLVKLALQDQKDNVAQEVQTDNPVLLDNQVKVVMQEEKDLEDNQDHAETQDIKVTVETKETVEQLVLQDKTDKMVLQEHEVHQDLQV